MKDLDSDTLIHTITRIKQGDVMAFARILDHYERMIYTVVFRMCRNQEDAEEITQDVFIRAFQNLGQFSKTSRFSSWLYKIAYNTSINFLRKKRIPLISRDIEDESIMDYGLSDENVWSTLRNHERISFVQMALSQLEPKDGTLLTLFYLGELSVKEIAEVLSVKTSTIKVQLHRARAKFYIELEKIIGNEIKGLL